ncbi:MAG: hypothetical protein A2504_12810 [Bdellovibrionales bacterium RIFOXYD12_FULL_39_22]|nr:MAG: hypothetical protein A2385_03895 [Bdellovibrionales bacterium RIFOXYB1_FULL_39_21]OFZ40495.1 MAG: hypothetical protein A2485_02760 [Bdellovibrionales bacterium RIFOXYC12_FULL_39_17]OFZ49978.1 MAG: hypothetical protein A2404_02095 [Bdellovibrionales bacterium RIFOXYC1_FULL_39_130]OFZ77620.1 MAG: hypothetical protein A2560_04655 [Bdellovibrionales bacterium RIFOXYD1_FULL_39_84]OFZ96074.1 MAG: hypothetical protein A2504_12810 [Bdellovibrionales bacterium RIFOXYD12_FULL_39_22]HLE10637.1 PQ
MDISETLANQFTTTKIIGWLASFFFAICGIPQAVDCWKRGNADGLSAWFLTSWSLGEVLMTIYVILQHGLDGPLLVNYAGNILALIVIVRYKILPRRQLE